MSQPWWELLAQRSKIGPATTTALSPRSRAVSRCLARRGKRTRPPEGEDGFTLVEVLVATILLGIGIVGAASVFSLSSRTMSAAEHRTQASHLAMSELETIQAIPYEIVGLDPEAKGFEASYADRESVVWTQSSASRTALVSPYSLRTIDGTEYTIIRNVTWAATGTGAYLVKRSYKVIDITINWIDSSGQHTIHQESGIFREGTV